MKRNQMWVWIIGIVAVAVIAVVLFRAHLDFPCSGGSIEYLRGDV